MYDLDLMFCVDLCHIQAMGEVFTKLCFDAKHYLENHHLYLHVIHFLQNWLILFCFPLMVHTGICVKTEFLSFTFSVYGTLYRYIFYRWVGEGVPELDSALKSHILQDYDVNRYLYDLWLTKIVHVHKFSILNNVRGRKKPSPHKL
jgi:hypothetical protein